MARQEADKKLGFYPASPEAITAILKHLALADQTGTPVHILDPCAGEGAAINQIAEGLKVDQENVFCVELDQQRADKVRELMPDANVVGPASYMGVLVSAASMGLVYCNPPFTDEFGGGRREELVFVKQATKHLPTGGVLCLVFPINAINGNRAFTSYLDSHYRNIAVYRFPDEHRKYRECVLFGYKRSAPIPEDRLSEVGTLHQMYWHYTGYNGDPGSLPALGDVQPAGWSSGRPLYDRETEPRVYGIPTTWRPGKFVKISYTDDELLQVIEKSPLGAILKEVPEVRIRRPPLPLSKGHVAMLLASGMLDGVVHKPGEPSHVIRGVATKKEVFNEEASTVDIDEEEGTARIKEVYSERIQLSVRAVDEEGIFYNFTDDDITPDAADQSAGAGQEKEAENLRNSEFPPGYDFDLAAKLARITVANGSTPAEEAQAKARLRAMKKKATAAAGVA
jgi:hypothetical protein